MVAFPSNKASYIISCTFYCRITNIYICYLITFIVTYCSANVSRVYSYSFYITFFYRYRLYMSPVRLLSNSSTYIFSSSIYFWIIYICKLHAIISRLTCYTTYITISSHFNIVCWYISYIFSITFSLSNTKNTSYVVVSLDSRIFYLYIITKMSINISSYTTNFITSGSYSNFFCNYIFYSFCIFWITD